MNLEPCPFCGGKAHIMKMGYPHWIYCENCGAKVHGGVVGEAEGEKASVEAWNKRQSQIVRCRDCKHAGTFDGANGEKCFYCTKYAGYILNDWVTDGDFFCSDGELKE